MFVQDGAQNDQRKTERTITDRAKILHRGKTFKNIGPVFFIFPEIGTVSARHPLEVLRIWCL